MRKIKSGFTFVELMITLAIFSVVMLGIIAIMSSTSTTFLKGSTDTELQTEGQIVMNQIADILMDADDKVIQKTAGEYYCVKNTNESGTTVYDHLKVDTTSNKLYFAQTANSNAVDVGSMQLLADYVDTISFVNNSSEDNAITVRVHMTNVDNEYLGEKEIFYRNNVESLTDHEIDPTPYITGGGGGGSTNKVEVNRFQDYNLMTLYGVSDIPTTTPTQQYGFLQADGTYSLTSLNYTVAKNGDGYYILKCTDGINKSFSSSRSEHLKAKTPAGDIEIDITTPAVSYEGGTGIHFYQYDGTVNDDNKSYFKIKGINVDGACKAGYAPTYELTCYVDGNNDHTFNGTDTQVGSTGTGTLQGSSVSSGAHQSGASSHYFSNSPKQALRVYGDCLSGFLVFGNPNDCKIGNHTTFVNDRVRVACKLTWPGGNGTKTIDIAVHAAGDDISNSFDTSGKAWKVY